MFCVRSLFAVLMVLICFTQYSCRNQRAKDVKADRGKLLSEIQRFKKAVLQNNKQEIASFFDFPVHSELIWYDISELDPAFRDKQLDVAAPVTRAFFLKEIGYLIGEQFTVLFRKVNIDSVSINGSYSYNYIVPTQPCMDVYGITLTGNDTVRFDLNMDTNPEYRLTEQDIKNEVDLSSLCEHMRWWTFVMKKGELKFVSTDGAD